MTQGAVAVLVFGLALTPLAVCLLAWGADRLRRRRETIAQRLDREHAERHRHYARRRA